MDVARGDGGSSENTHRLKTRLWREFRVRGAAIRCSSYGSSLFCDFHELTRYIEGIKIYKSKYCL